MSTSLVHFITVAGRASLDLEVACTELLTRRNPRLSASYGSDDWTGEDHQDIAHFCTDLIDATRELPVFYHAQYLDAGSIGLYLSDQLKSLDGKRRLVCGSGYHFAFFPSEHHGTLLTQIRKMRRRSFYRQQRETRWFLEHLYEAIDTVLWLECPFLVVAIDQVLGPSRWDEELKAGLDTPLKRNSATVD